MSCFTVPTTVRFVRSAGFDISTMTPPGTSCGHTYTRRAIDFTIVSDSKVCSPLFVRLICIYVRTFHLLTLLFLVPTRTSQLTIVFQWLFVFSLSFLFSFDICPVYFSLSSFFYLTQKKNIKSISSHNLYAPSARQARRKFRGARMRPCAAGTRVYNTTLVVVTLTTFFSVCSKANIERFRLFSARHIPTGLILRVLRKYNNRFQNENLLPHNHQYPLPFINSHIHIQCINSTNWPPLMKLNIPYKSRVRSVGNIGDRK